MQNKFKFNKQKTDHRNLIMKCNILAYKLEHRNLKNNYLNRRRPSRYTAQLLNTARQPRIMRRYKKPISASGNGITTTSANQGLKITSFKVFSRKRFPNTNCSRQVYFPQDNSQLILRGRRYQLKDQKLYILGILSSAFIPNLSQRSNCEKCRKSINILSLCKLLIAYLNSIRPKKMRELSGCLPLTT